MSDALDEDLVQRIDSRGTIQWSGTCFRYTGAQRDPLSGEGARRFGGRWNPPLLFSAIYLADSAQACMVEVERAAQAASTTPEGMLEAHYRLHTIDATHMAVLDLTTSEAREAVGLEDDDIYGDDWSACQAVGHAAWFLHVQGVLVPAAGRPAVGAVLVAHERLLLAAPRVGLRPRRRPVCIGSVCTRSAIFMPCLDPVLRRVSGSTWSPGSTAPWVICPTRSPPSRMPPPIACACLFPNRSAHRKISPAAFTGC